MLTTNGQKLHDQLVTLNAALTTFLNRHVSFENARGVIPQERQAVHKEIAALRQTRTELMGEIMAIKGLIGNQTGKKEIELTQTQLDRIKELEASIAKTIDKLDQLDAPKNKGHHNIPGTLDIVGKLEVLQDLFHVKTSKDLKKALPDKRIRSIVASDKATRTRQALVYRAAQGDESALKQFYSEYAVLFPSWKQMKTPDGQSVKSEVDFVANMQARSPEQRAELIYRWSDIPKDVAEKAALTPADAPISEDETPTLSARDITTIVSTTADLLRKTEGLDEALDTFRATDDSYRDFKNRIDDPDTDQDAIDWIQDTNRSYVRRSEKDYDRE